MAKQYYVYIMTNEYHTVLYTGVTSNLVKRVHEHRSSSLASFTGRYKAGKLVYYEVSDDIRSAISREKQIKGGSRERKVALIEGMNSNWRDLYDDIV